jgi:hypothetical protein
VTAALAWFDEDPADLHQFVRALDGAVDRLVAVDGAYARYPHESHLSDDEEVVALERACAEIGLPLELHRPKAPWRGQVEKRTFLIQAAAKNSDWIFTLDADHILRGVREAFRQELARVRADRIEVEFFTTVNPVRALAETSSTEWHSELAGKTVRMGLLLRALPETQYERFHWWVSANKEGRRVWLYGGDESLPHVQAHDLKAPFFVEHRCHFRRDRNILANRLFCEDRIELVATTGQEDTVAA